MEEDEREKISDIESYYHVERVTGRIKWDVTQKKSSAWRVGKLNLEQNQKKFDFSTTNDNVVENVFTMMMEIMFKMA